MKMKSVGIIAEYNPFHNGHLYHMKKSKEVLDADVTIVAMSGNFVQRGQVAIADKWSRAAVAVKSGADLVVEIPVIFACNSAPYFAKAGVKILESLGADYISFGSETGNIEKIMGISEEIKQYHWEIETYITSSVRKGLTYPRAREEAIRRILGDEVAELLNSPNNILALEYLKNMRKAEPIAIKREGPGYNDLDLYKNLASATAIRYLLDERKDVSAFIPRVSATMLSKNPRPVEDLIFKMICQKVLITKAEKLDKACAGGEGLGNKIKNSIRMVNSYSELIDELKSKRYTRTRIERFLMHILLEIESPELMNNYIRILGFNKKGSEYLKYVKNNKINKLPIITNINKELDEYPEIEKTVSKDILAMDLYNIFTDRDLYRHSDFVAKPYVGK